MPIVSGVCRASPGFAGRVRGWPEVSGGCRGVARHLWGSPGLLAAMPGRRWLLAIVPRGLDGPGPVRPDRIGPVRPGSARTDLAWNGPGLACLEPDRTWTGPDLAWPALDQTWLGPDRTGPGLAWPGSGLDWTWPGPSLAWPCLAWVRIGSGLDRAGRTGPAVPRAMLQPHRAPCPHAPGSSRRRGRGSRPELSPPRGVMAGFRGAADLGPTDGRVRWGHRGRTEGSAQAAWGVPDLVGGVSSVAVTPGRPTSSEISPNLIPSGCGIG